MTSWHTDMEFSLDTVKIIVLISLLIMTFLCGMVPILFMRFISKVTDHDDNSISTEERLRHKARLATYKKVLSFLSCFAAGVFLATCFLDLLPGVRHNLIEVLDSIKVYTGFPIAEFVMVIGLFIILIVEQIVLTAKESQRSASFALSNNTANESNDDRQPLLNSREQDNRRDELTESHRSDHSLGGIDDEPHIPSVPDEWDSVERRTDGIIPTLSNTNSSLATEGTSPRFDGGNHVKHFERHISRSHSPNSLQTHSPLRAMLLLFALALHSVFEGLSVGLQMEVSGVLSIFGALAVHKSILSFSLGMNMIQSRISIKSAVKSIVLFSLSSPVGIAIGIGISDLWNTVSSGLVHGLLQGIASGTFLYIIFFEILPKEFNSEGNRLLKVLCLLIGYSAVTGILFLSNDIKFPFCVQGDSDKPVP